MHTNMTYRCHTCETIEYLGNTCSYEYKWWHRHFLRWLIIPIKNFVDNFLTFNVL